MISVGAFDDFNIWRHSRSVRDLYLARVRDEAEEMTCAAQAAELLGDVAAPGDSLLDVGCGTGWFAHSLRRRGLELDYWGVDQTEEFIDIARRELPASGVRAEQLLVGDLALLHGTVDHVVCMNVLSNIDNWLRGLDRFAAVATKSVILRESLGAVPSYRLVDDEYLDDVVLKVHVNTYATDELIAFMDERGFDGRVVVDRRTGGAPEHVIGHPHHWTFLVFRRRSAAT